MQVSPERAAAIEIEQQILDDWRRSNGSRHISEFARLRCATDWDFTITTLIGGAPDVQVRPRAGKAPAEGVIHEPRILPAEGDEPAMVVVAIVWPWPDQQPPDLPERVKEWRDNVITNGTFT
jgi:hypothetical protein